MFVSYILVSVGRVVVSIVSSMIVYEGSFSYIRVVKVVSVMSRLCLLKMVLVYIGW